MDRRRFLIGTGVGISAATRIFTASAQTPAPAAADAPDTTIISALPPLPADLADKSMLPAVAFVEQLVGTGAPSTEDRDKAYDILIGAPFGSQPIDVAQYFLAVGAGAYGADRSPFAREWPVRANPMIMHFFSATQTKPEGDVTAWCAAFMNWCLLRAHATSADEIGRSDGSYINKGRPFPADNLKRYSTNSASSGSFRCWTEITTPQRGDIVVFKNAGTDGMTAACQGTGHVTFFVKIPSPGLVQVLGGNQSLPGSNGAITVANMSTRPGSRFMKYVSPKT